MSKALSNPKFFAAVTVLFALATLINAAVDSGNGPHSRGLVPPGIAIDLVKMSSGPSLPPDLPDEEGKLLASGPSLPPDLPDEEGKLLASGPSLPPDLPDEGEGQLFSAELIDSGRISLT